MTTNVGGGAETQPHCPPPPPVGARAARPCDFFQRTRYYRVMPKYHAVRIRQEQRYPPAGPRRKKHWVTSWQQPEDRKSVV